MDRIQVLIYAPEEGFSKQLVGRLESAGLTALAEYDPYDAQRLLSEKSFDVVLFAASDEHDRDLEVLERIHTEAPRAAIILLEQGGDVDFVIQAKRKGIFDDILVPFDLSELLNKIRAAASTGPWGDQNDQAG